MSRREDFNSKMLMSVLAFNTIRPALLHSKSTTEQEQLRHVEKHHFCEWPHAEAFLESWRRGSCPRAAGWQIKMTEARLSSFGAIKNQ